MTAFREPFPILTVADVDQATEFYCSTFGFEKTYAVDGEDGTRFAFLELAPHGMGIAERQSAEDPDFAIWIYTDDVDAAAERLRTAGAEEVQAPIDQEWGERMCSFRDSDGHLIHVGAKS